MRQDGMAVLQSGLHNFAAKAKPAPTPKVPNGPGSIHCKGPFGLIVYAAVAAKSPPSTIIIESFFIT